MEKREAFIFIAQPSREKELWSKRNKLEVSKYNIDESFKELISLFKGYKKDITIWKDYDRNKIETYIKKFNRLIYNYISASYSILGHLENFYKNEDNLELKKLINKEKRKLEEDKKISFIKGIRNLIQHHRFPLTIANGFGFKNKRIIYPKFCLNKKDLMLFNGWNEIAKNYLKKLPKEINLEPIIRYQNEKINNLYNIIYKKITKIFCKEISTYEEALRHF